MFAEHLPRAVPTTSFRPFDPDERFTGEDPCTLSVRSSQGPAASESTEHWRGGQPCLPIREALLGEHGVGHGMGLRARETRTDRERNILGC